ncbi:MAG: ActS/PrrB/RegB family redox-sensitive histidine kinase [Alphaproteobacteria bacterium]
MALEFMREFGAWRRSLRLETLVRLRWFAVAGQTLAIVMVYWGLGYGMPISLCLLSVAASAWLNILLRLRYPSTHRLSTREAGVLLSWDILQLALLLFLTGGLENPFAFLLLAPVLIAATALPPRTTLTLGVMAVACATAVGFVHLPLPWAAHDDLRLPPLYVAGIWLSLVLCLGFIGLYAFQVSEESRQLSDALAATELVLAREQHLSQLDGLAAAAAHELGTPLATIALVVKELSSALPKDGLVGDDMALLREQVQRCRDIMSKLKNLSGGDAPFDLMTLAQLIEETAQPYRFFEIPIVVDIPTGGEGEPLIPRNPGVLYGLGNIIENAVDFAASQVTVSARWTTESVVITVIDDGPGFAPEIMDRIGEPYLTRRGFGLGGRDGEDDQRGGLGLGVFIAKTLIERSGGRMLTRNRPAPETGACVEITWPRADFERARSGPPREEIVEGVLPNRPRMSEN